MTKKQMEYSNIIAFFETLVEKSPDDIALCFEKQRLTYRELNNKANQLARHLKSKGIKPEQFIGVYTERSMEMFVAILSILKVGAAYVPLDARYPRNRLEWILRDADINTVLTHAHLVENITGFTGKVIRLDVDQDEFAQFEEQNLDEIIGENQLAYVNYTSGSTGKPKGVCIEHLSVCNLAQQVAQTLRIEKQDKVAQFTSISFDVSVMEWASTFYRGATLIILPVTEKVTPINALLKTAQKIPITIAVLTPTVASLLSPELLPDLKILMVTAEPCPSKIFNIWSNEVLLINGYGPTETTGIATAFLCDDKYPLTTIGYPLEGVEVYILDDHLVEVEPGEAGELYIGGVGLARKYLNQPLLTEQSFMYHPQHPSKRLYKTGDIVCQLDNGAINYIGRADDQVTIDGHRIELHEVNFVIDKIDWILESCALVYRQTYNRNSIVAFITLVDGEKEKTSALVKNLKSHLELFLPKYMVPSQIIVLDCFPINENGKIDKNKLLSQFSDNQIKIFTSEKVDYKDDCERKIAEACGQLVNKKDISASCNLAELGFDSIMLIQLVSHVRRYGIKLDVHNIFQKRTIAEIAKNAKNLNRDNNNDFNKINHIRTAPLTIAQQWLMDQQLDNIHYWNQATVLKIREEVLDLCHLQQAIYSLMKQHVALNNVYRSENGELKQFLVEREVSNNFHFYSIDNNNEDEIKKYIDSKLQKHHGLININNGPLIQFVLFKYNLKNQYDLVIIVHHFLIDGISWKILFNSLYKYYQYFQNGKSVQEEPDLTFLQWTTDLKGWLKLKPYEEERSYWENVTGSKLGLVPTENYTHFDLYGMVKTLDFELDAVDTSKLLKGTHRLYSFRIDEILLASLAMMFHQVNQQEYLYLMLTAHGREFVLPWIDISNTMGWFTNFYPIRLHIKDTEQTVPFFNSIKEQLQSVPSRGFGYGILNYFAKNQNNEASKLNKTLPNILFNYSGQWSEKISPNSNWLYDGLMYHSCQDESNQRPFNIEINIEVIENKCRIYWSYCRHQFQDSTIEKWANAYLICLKKMLSEKYELPNNSSKKVISLFRKRRVTTAQRH